MIYSLSMFVKYMFIVLFIAIVIIFFYSCCKVSSNESRLEEKDTQEIQNKKHTCSCEECQKDKNI